MLLPPDRIEVGAKLRQAFQLDRGHLLVTVEDVIGHLIHVRGLLLVVSQVYDAGPPEILECHLNLFIMYGLHLDYFGTVSIFLRF